MVSPHRDVHVVHALPGRVRLKSERLKDPAVAERAEARLRSQPGVRAVEANPVTGSLLVVHAPHETGWRRLLSDLGLRVSSLVPDGAAEGNGAGRPARPAAETVAEFFRDVNRQVGQATGGADLKVLVPGVLVALGLGGLLLAERVRPPRWYDFLWFAFGTFMMLNVAGADGIAAAEALAD